MDEEFDKENNTTSKDIIKQLRDAQQQSERGVEKTREVVVRPDGTKVIRVHKRKKTFSTKEVPRRSVLKNVLLLMLVGGVLITAVGAAWVMYKMTVFNKPEYHVALQEDLGQSLGGKVSFDGLVVEGMGFVAYGAKIEFPEPCLVKQIELRGVAGDIMLRSFLVGKLAGDTVTASSVSIVLRNEVKEMQLPHLLKNMPVDYKRVNAHRASIVFEDRVKAPFSMSGNLHVRTAQNGQSTVCELSGYENLQLRLRGWPVITLSNAVFHLSRGGLESAYIVGTFGEKRDGAASCAIKSDAVPAGTNLYAAQFNVSGINVSLSDIALKRFDRILTATMGADTEDESEWMSLSCTLPQDGDLIPRYDGTTGSMSSISWFGLPIFIELVDVTERKEWSRPILMGGRAKLVSDGTKVELQQISMREAVTCKIMGDIVTTPTEVSGSLSLGTPVSMASHRTVDVDPFFTTKDEADQSAWVSVQLSGSVAIPTDNSKQLAVAADAKRASMAPAPIEPIKKEGDIAPPTNDLFPPADSTPASPPADTSGGLPASSID